MVTLAAILLVGATRPIQSLPPTRPKLVVVISVDQLRADYLRRFSGAFLPARTGSKVGGFRYLMAEGSDYADAHYAHVPTATGPGHATLLTGSGPCLTGIVGNEWFDATTGKVVYCVADPGSKTVGGQSSPMSPRNLLVTTVGDELNLATRGRSREVSISFKDRAATLMAGHAADTVIWLESKTGNWVTSDWYAKSGSLPGWVDTLNKGGAIQKSFGQSWEPLAGIQPALGKFSHPIQSVSSFAASGFGQEYLFKTVTTALDEEKLGRHDATDLLTVNLATNDYVGHAYGPYSPEVEDITIRTDRLLSELLNAIDKRVGLNRTIIALTADHGVAPIPEDAAKMKLPAHRWAGNLVEKGVNSGLSSRYGEGKWVLEVTEPYVYLDHAVVASKKLDLAEVRRAAAEIAGKIDGVYCAFTADQVLAGALPHWGWTEKVYLGFNPARSGDVIVCPAPGDYIGVGLGTGHGTPWAYDTHVPLLLVGPGVRRGQFMRPVTVMDLAPTLSQLIGIEYPSGNLGRVLQEALEKS